MFELLVPKSQSSRTNYTKQIQTKVKIYSKHTFKHCLAVFHQNAILLSMVDDVLYF